MLLDNQLVFDNFTAVNFTGTTYSASQIDLTGGVAMNIGNATRFGEDLGLGQGDSWPQIIVIAGLALTSTAAATLNIQFQGSTDSTNWDTYVETGAIAKASLTANTAIWKVQWPHRAVGASLPRYVRLNYIPAVGAISSGTIFAAVTLGRQDWPLDQYPAAYTAV